MAFTLEGPVRFKVPQNIDMQDRVLGPLTMVQFVYAVVGFGICYSIFMSIPAPFSYVLIAPIGLFVFCLIFVKINERPFIDFVVAALEFMTSPKQRYWQQAGDSNLRVEIYKSANLAKPTYQHKNITPEEIADLASKVDTGNRDLIKN